MARTTRIECAIVPGLILKGLELKEFTRFAAYLWNRAEVISLSAQLVLGLLLIIYGLLIVPVIPHVQLDAVLTPEEFADDSRRESVLNLLRRANKNAWVDWVAIGLLILFLSVLGLSAALTKAYPAWQKIAGGELAKPDRPEP